MSADTSPRTSCARSSSASSASRKRSRRSPTTSRRSTPRPRATASTPRRPQGHQPAEAGFGGAAGAGSAARPLHARARHGRGAGGGGGVAARRAEARRAPQRSEATLGVARSGRSTVGLLASAGRRSCRCADRRRRPRRSRRCRRRRGFSIRSRRLAADRAWSAARRPSGGSSRGDIHILRPAVSRAVMVSVRGVELERTRRHRRALARAGGLLARASGLSFGIGMPAMLRAHQRLHRLRGKRGRRRRRRAPWAAARLGRRCWCAAPRW